MTYAEKLKHPKWQKKRLEILNRADFYCEDCTAAHKTLHVHHGYYRPGADPWDYENETLHALCEDCHLEAEKVRQAVLQEIGRLNVDDVRHLWGYLFGRRLNRKDSLAAKPIQLPDWSMDFSEGLERGLCAEERNG